MKARLSDAPLAITIDGRLLANIVEFASVDPGADVSAALEAAASFGTGVFIGVEIPRAETATILTRLEDAAAEALAKAASRQRLRRATARRRRKTAS